MRRLRRGVTIVPVLGLLVLTAPAGTAGAADDPGEPAAVTDVPLRRKVPSEVPGRGASVSAMRSGRLSCGDTITQSTTLTADVGPGEGNGVIIGADKIILNLNGHTISGSPGPANGNTAGIRLPNRSGVRITGQPGNTGRTGTVTGFDAAVFINGGSANTVENLTVRENGGADRANAPLLADGIAVFNSANNLIQGNVVDRNGVYDGIAVLGNDSHANTIRGNTVTNTVTCVNPPLENYCNGTGTGIIVSAFLDVATGKLVHGNDVLDNVIRSNAGSGISNINTRDGRVAGNTIEDNGHLQWAGNGIGLQMGLRPESSITRMVVESNTIRRNGGNGIESLEAEENQFLGNVIEYNGYDSAPSFDPAGGIMVETEIGGNIIKGNKIHHNRPSGIRLDGSDGSVPGRTDNNRVEGNTVTNNDLVGIFFIYDGRPAGPNAWNNFIVSNYVVNNRRFDLVDGSLFRPPADCRGALWDDNTYETAAPPCAGAGGTQVSVS